jgi:hypothetical protein
MSLESLLFSPEGSEEEDDLISAFEHTPSTSEQIIRSKDLCLRSSNLAVLLVMPIKQYYLLASRLVGIRWTDPFPLGLTGEGPKRPPFSGLFPATIYFSYQFALRGKIKEVRKLVYGLTLGKEPGISLIFRAFISLMHSERMHLHASH